MVNCWEWIDEIFVLVGFSLLECLVFYLVVWIVGVMMEGVYLLVGKKEELRMIWFLVV